MRMTCIGGPPVQFPLAGGLIDDLAAALAAL
jgi:hypothetical protein